MNYVVNAHGVLKLNHSFLLREKRILYCKSFRSVLEPRIAHSPLPRFSFLIKTCTLYSDFQRTVKTYIHLSLYWSNISLCFAYFYLLFTGYNFHCKAIFALALGLQSTSSFLVPQTRKNRRHYMWFFTLQESKFQKYNPGLFSPSFL